MKNSFFYKSLKALLDQSVRQVGEWMPAILATQYQDGVAATAPFNPTLPVNKADLPVGVARYFQETLMLPARQIFLLTNVYVSWHNTIFKNLRIFRPALAHPSVETLYSDAYLLKQWAAPQVASPAEPVALVHDQWTRGNYYHWMVDSLSRLLVLKQHHPEALLLMPEPIPGYVRTTAALLGFTRLLGLPMDHILHANHLLVPQHVAPPGLQNPVLLRQVRSTLVQALHFRQTLPIPTRRIYVSRARQNSRHLANEMIALAVLARYGFETVYFEDYTFEQQVSIMLETSVLLGVHGANLTNLLFMQPGAVVIELMNVEKFIALENKDFENLIYYRMSSALELPYFAVLCQNAAGQVPSNYSDVEVDTAELEAILEQL